VWLGGLCCGTETAAAMQCMVFVMNGDWIDNGTGFGFLNGDALLTLSDNHELYQSTL
jgi:hypothetical protein